MTLLTFPKNFVWGTATASYQIEGYPLADGAGPSIWHRFSHTPGNVRGGHNGDLACEHYRRYPDDIALMKSLGIQGYRMSTAWPRVLPEGRGRSNEAGLDFYDRLIDALLEADITPYVTLYHWDLPSDLQDMGGWANPAIADWFTEYASVMFERLGDRVKNWITLNEPSVVMDRGHVFGQHAPGMRDIWAALRVAHNQLVAHGRAVRAFRASGADGEIGIALNLHPQHAATDSEEDRICAIRTDAYYNRLFMDPIFKGEYPAEALDWFGEAWPNIGPGDLDEISTHIDFLGVNYYFPQVVAHRAGQGALHSEVLRQPAPTRTSAGRSALKGSTMRCGPCRPSTAILRCSSLKTARPSTTTRTQTVWWQTMPDSTTSAPSRRSAPRHLRRRQSPGLFPVDAHGQLRVGIRVRCSLWHNQRGLHNPEANGQEIRAMVRRRYQSQRRDQRLTGTRCHM